MKKLMIGVALLSVSSLFAQTPAPAEKESKAKMETPQAKAQPVAQPAKAKPAASTAAMSTTTPVKKNKSVDKSHKATKPASKEVAPGTNSKAPKESPKPAPAAK